MFVMAPGMKYLVLFLLSLCLAGWTVSADDQVRRAQEALRKRNLYFGEIDGRKNEEITGAIRRYQQRQGLPPTGDLTSPTLASLGIGGAAKPGEEWPEGPVLKSDVARQISEADRRFLEDNPAPTPEPIAEVSPAAPPVVIPPEASAQPEKPSEPPGAARTADPETPTQFVRKYLAACETNRLAEEMGFYAPRMSYFDHGLVDAAFVARDVQHFYKRWPHRRYELLDCKITPLRESEWEARFRIAFHYTNDKAEAVSGRSLNLFKIQKGAEGLHFISMKEQVLRE
jgi:hypothetical protein